MNANYIWHGSRYAGILKLQKIYIVFSWKETCTMLDSNKCRKKIVQVRVIKIVEKFQF